MTRILQVLEGRIFDKSQPFVKQRFSLDGEHPWCRLTAARKYEKSQVSRDAFCAHHLYPMSDEATTLSFNVDRNGSVFEILGDRSLSQNQAANLLKSL